MERAVSTAISGDLIEAVMIAAEGGKKMTWGSCQGHAKWQN
jgi:hypothetical protein